MMNGMSLHPYPKGGLTGCQISIRPFDMTSHPLTRFQIRIPIKYPQKKCSRFRSYPWSKDIHRSTFTVQVTFMTKISKEVHVLPKLMPDDKASSKTHLVRFMHNVVTSKFKIFSVAKARCWYTRLSPKTPKVLPVRSSSSKIQFLG